MPSVKQKISKNPPAKLAISQLVDRFGSNRLNAAEPGKLLADCDCVLVPFAGGLCEVPHFRARIVLVNDVDRNVINLCNVLRTQRARLVNWLDATPYHADQLTESQDYCKKRQIRLISDGYPPNPFDWACHYFVASWLTRGGSGGTVKEFDGKLSVRWKAGGGDSVVRFRSAIEGLASWEETMKRCAFTALDAFDFLAEVAERDVSGNGVYCDPPWPDDGDQYAHRFGEDDQRRLAVIVGGFRQSKIVIRFGDHQLIRDLYPESSWQWVRLEGRTQANKPKAEVLICRRCERKL